MASNHPVESTLTAGASAFYYQRVSLVATDAPTSTTVYGGMAQTNRGYLMPFPRTAQQQGHAPICQQCHEDSRSVGSAGAATDFKVTSPDGTNASDNPRFQNFPHETANPSLLVETGDDLCTNCHTPARLP
jgi:hypothetical protein